MSKRAHNKKGLWSQGKPKPQAQPSPAPCRYHLCLPQGTFSSFFFFFGNHEFLFSGPYSQIKTKQTNRTSSNKISSHLSSQASATVSCWLQFDCGPSRLMGSVTCYSHDNHVGRKFPEGQWIIKTNYEGQVSPFPSIKSGHAKRGRACCALQQGADLATALVKPRLVTPGGTRILSLDGPCSLT